MLAEARHVLRKELIEMAREEFTDYQLTEEQRARLARIATFPQVEPKISITRLDEDAPRIRALAAHGSFVPLRPGAEACYADYDHPGGKLVTVSHGRAEGPVDVNGKPAVRVDGLGFGGDGKVEWTWRPYYHLEGDTVLYCAKQCGHPDEGLPLVTPSHPDWKEPQPRPEPLALEPGSGNEPDGDRFGLLVDASLFEVKIGRRVFRCVRRIGGGARWKVDWSETPVTFCATEEFYLDDGRLLLWRRYNGLKWSEKDPHRRNDQPGTYERLAENGVPVLDVFGDVYYLWYDQIPDYATQ